MGVASPGRETTAPKGGRNVGRSSAAQPHPPTTYRHHLHARTTVRL